MNIIAVDPGASATGIVYMSNVGIIACETYHGSKVGYDQEELVQRMGEITRTVLAFSADKPHELVVCEGFIGYAGMQGGFTYQTPELVGYLARAWEHAGEKVVWQTSRQVLNHRTKGAVVTKDLVEAYGKSKAREVALAESGWAGTEMCTNDHLRAAALHGIYFYRRNS